LTQIEKQQQHLLDPPECRAKWPTSDRNDGRLQIGTGGRFQFGMHGRRHRNPHERPIVSVNQVRDLTGTSYPAANQLVEQLVKIGILAEMTGQAPHRRFQYNTYVRLFDETEASDAEVPA